jgi:hypothetical protein
VAAIVDALDEAFYATFQNIEPCNKLNVSAFITYTDSETWAGSIHPAQAQVSARVF